MRRRSTLITVVFGASDVVPSQVFYREGSPPPRRLLKPGVWETDPKAGMNEMFEPATFLGLAAVALWAYVRYPRLRPQSLVWAALQVAISFITFSFLPATLSLLLPLAPSPSARLFVALALLIPALTYVLLSWIWLIARIIELLGGTPRGGHPVTIEH